MIQIWALPGGVHPAENKTQSLQLPLVDCPLATEYILPLNQHIGAAASPVVKVGEHVLKYQPIAEAQGIFSAGVHAPTSGTVSAIEDRFIAHPSGLKAPCIVLQADGQDEACELQPTLDPFTLPHATLVQKIRAAGLVGMGGAGFPSAVKLNPKANTPIKTLIINGTECEPYITADDVLMQTYAQEVIDGTRLLAHTLGNPQRIVVGIEDNKPKAIAALKAVAANTGIEILSFPTKYPSGGEKQLIYILTGQEVASGQIPASLGIVVQNVGTALAAWRAVRYGEPLIERITTVVGQSFATQRNMRIRIGTPINHVLEHNGFSARRSARLIVGGPMMGFAIEQTSIPVVKTTNCLLAPSHAEMPEAPPAQACIRCGHCAEVCPAGLLPQQLYWYARSDDHDKLQSHNLFDCIECGACSYVCPSSIPLVQYYRAAKGDIRQALEDKKKSDRARERFEQRQERLAKEEAAKEAKRLERKAAAEKNKSKLAEAGINTPAASEMVNQAVSAANNAPNATQEQARLSRTLESLNNRVARLQGQMAEAEDDARREKLASQLKQTELSLKDTTTKLEALGKPINNQLASSIQETLSAQGAAALQKLNTSPVELAQKNLATLQKRLATAHEKLAEAKAEGKSTIEALTQGIQKLEEKVALAAQALQDAPQEPTTNAAPAMVLDAAENAIARAQEKAKATASMTAEQKHAANLASLEQRLTKARARLQKAEEENDENLAAFAASVQKLEQKRLEAKH